MSGRACAPPRAAAAEAAGGGGGGGDHHQLGPYGAMAAANDDCTHPEIFVRAPIGDAGFNESASSRVDKLDESHALAYAEIWPASTAGVRTTDGRYAEAGGEIARVRININTRLLWRLDGQFCVPFNLGGNLSGHLVFKLG